jgi:hypothetical protein
VRGHDPHSILESMVGRIDNDEERERHTALTQIGLIAGYRLADGVATPPAAEATAMAERLAAADHAAPALLREWMLAANLGVHRAQGTPGEFLGVLAQSASPQIRASAHPDAPPANPQPHASAHSDPRAANPRTHTSAPPSPQHLLVGLYSDPTTKAVCRDGRLAPVLGIAVAQHLRQQQIPTRLGLLVLASPASPRTGSVLFDPDPLATLVPTDIDSLVPFKTAGIPDQCLTVVHRGTALPEGNAAAIDRAIRTLEHLLI